MTPEQGFQFSALTKPPVIYNFSVFLFYKVKYEECWNVTVSKKVKGILAGDFNYDGTIDFLATMDYGDKGNDKHV